MTFFSLWHAVWTDELHQEWWGVPKSISLCFFTQWPKCISSPLLASHQSSTVSLCPPWLHYFWLMGHVPIDLGSSPVNILPPTSVSFLLLPLYIQYAWALWFQLLLILVLRWLFGAIIGRKQTSNNNNKTINKHPHPPCCPWLPLPWPHGSHHLSMLFSIEHSAWKSLSPILHQFLLSLQNANQASSFLEAFLILLTILFPNCIRCYAMLLLWRFNY